MRSGDPPRSSADHAAIQLKRVGAPQVRYCRQWNNAAQIDGLLRREPERQLPSRRMPGRNHALQIQVVAVRKRDQMLGSADDVVRHSGPIAARIAHPAILQAPYRGASSRQCGAQVTGMIQVVSVSPVAAVNKDHGGMRAGAMREEKIAELRGAFP